jgi:hypothetical protein
MATETRAPRSPMCCAAAAAGATRARNVARDRLANRAWPAARRARTPSLPTEMLFCARKISIEDCEFLMIR